MVVIASDNIFMRLLRSTLDENPNFQIRHRASALITKDLLADENAIGFIPTMDLINYNKLFVSKSIGLSFEGSLCNSYIYFKEKEKQIDSIHLLGDVSSVEVILTKLLFKENYYTDVEVNLSASKQTSDDINFILTGDENFKDDKFLNGISFSEEMIESLNLPFVNYVLASRSSEALKEANEKLKSQNEKIYEKIASGNFGDELTMNAKKYIAENISSLVLEFEEQDVEGIKQLLYLPYYHGLINDIVEIKLV
jgi:hypothetical protein